VPHLLTCTKRDPCHSQELFDHLNADENFLKNIVPGDETWVYINDVETKVQSLQWMGILLP
jgi:hypothetical protein